MVERRDQLLMVPGEVADDAAVLAQREAARVGLAVEPRRRYTDRLGSRLTSRGSSLLRVWSACFLK